MPASGMANDGVGEGEGVDRGGKVLRHEEAVEGAPREPLSIE